MEETKRVAKLSEEEEAQAEVEIWNYIFGFAKMAVAKCAIELGIPDAVGSHEIPISLTELSSVLGCEPSRLHRIMRFLVHFQVFKEKATSQGTTGYIQTPLSRRMMKQGENSMAALILLETSPVMLAPWHHLSDHVSSGTFPFVAAHSVDVWSYTARDASHSNLVDEAMACGARAAVPAIINGCPEVFDGIGSLVDVGGGNGTTLRMLVKAFPWIKGINFDLPHVVSVAPELDSIKKIGGDMFHSVPKADAAFLMWCLHDWDDQECIKILKNCREAIPVEKGKVIIAEAVIGEEREEDDKLDFVRLMLDMVMMAHTSKGKERTLKEWDYVLTKAGFRRYNIRHIRAASSLIEAFP
ncbi:hypothetical protein SLE2022_041970 [Rubroshorea leprosula]